ncbi:MAG: ubiquitin-conjugating enzyme E2 [Burkholderiaceae bacterium]
MSGLNKRRQADIERLERLCAHSRGQLQILSLPSGSNQSIVFQLNLPTAGDARYPGEVQAMSRFRVDLPVRYPFEAPTARMVETPIHHPNVFESGVVCVGSRWNPSEGLDLYVTRLCRLLTFDRMLVNMNSVANSAAGHWYNTAVRKHPDQFPTAAIQWDTPVEKVVRACPACGTKIRLPSGKSGIVQCPKCANDFEART